MKNSIQSTIVLALLATLLLAQGIDYSHLPERSREQIIQTARQYSEHAWTCGANNQEAKCVTAATYQCKFKPGDTITGIAYDWGGFDSPEEFDRKLAAGQAAGSHSKEGITNCTTGIDCSGFVMRCWGIDTDNPRYTTSTIRSIAPRPKYIWYTEMQPGDALVKPGSHIVLFAGYSPANEPMVYEASGSASRVIFQVCSWGRFRDYYPLVYRGVK
ncbi:MAG TPA: hypothetical protein PLN61_00165 [bacterium]|nr:hypothetical protein [bacterium]HQI47054.1 hypothetical protein [bacterium]HQJ65389.1 hypothetical protein [bacterium]